MATTVKIRPGRGKPFKRTGSDDMDSLIVWLLLALIVIVVAAVAAVALQGNRRSGSVKAGRANPGRRR